MSKSPIIRADWLVRQAARLHRTPLDRYRITMARSADELEEAFSLLHDAYLRRGLSAQARSAMRITSQHVLREAAVFVAYQGQQMVGTLTVTLDSPAGLPLDNEYPHRLGERRQSGARLVEFNSLAVLPSVRRSGVTALLFMAAHWVARNILCGTHVCIGINPRAEWRYRALFDFQSLGQPKTHGELQAPVVGLVHNVSGLPEFFKKHYGRRMSSGLTVYEHFVLQLPPCVHIPAEFRRDNPESWRLRRDAFQDMFMRRTRHLFTLDPATKEHLSAQRTDDTLSFTNLTGGRTSEFVSGPRRPALTR